MPPFRTPVTDEEEIPEYAKEVSPEEIPSYAKEITPKKEPKKPLKATGPGYDYQMAHPEERKPFDTSPLGWKSALKWATTPLTEAPSRFAKSVSEHINPESQTKGIRGVGSAFVEGLGQAASDLTSPLNLATVAIPGAGKIAGTAMVGHGAYRTTKGVIEGNPEEAISGGVEALVGGVGARGHATPSAKTESAVRQSREVRPVRMSGDISKETPKDIELPREAAVVPEEPLPVQQPKKGIKNPFEKKPQAVPEEGSIAVPSEGKSAYAGPEIPLKESPISIERRKDPTSRYTPEDIAKGGIEERRLLKAPIDRIKEPEEVPDYAKEVEAPVEAPINKAQQFADEVKTPEPQPATAEESLPVRQPVKKGLEAARSIIPPLEQPIEPLRASLFADETGEFNITSAKNFLSSIYQRLTGGTAVKDVVEQIKKDPLNSKVEEEGTVPAVTKFLSALEDAKGRMKEQVSINKAEMAKRFADSASVKETGAAGAAKSLSKMKGEFNKVNPGERLQLNPKETDSLFDAVGSANITEAEKINARFSLFKLLNGEQTPNRSELKILDDVFGHGFADKIVEMHGGIGMVGMKIGKVSNTMKSMLNTVNVAAPILHGLPLTSHPMIFGGAAKDMIKFMANKETYNAAMEAIESRPNYKSWKEAGLFTAKPETLSSGEEDFANSYVGNIPGVRSIVATSRRGYTGFLNELRSKVADQLEKNARDQGLEVFSTKRVKLEDGTFSNVKEPTDIAKNIAKYINNATDRGSLGKLEKIAPEMNYLLWSPRRLTARATMLNPAFYYKLDSFTRKEALKSLFAQAAAGTSMVTLGVLAGGKTSLDPRNSDFGKVRFGSHVLNPLGPTQSLVIAASKTIKELQRMKSGKKAAFGEQNIPEIAGNLVRNRESPIMRLADEVATARQITGDSKAGDVSKLSPPEFGGFTNRFGNKKFISSEIRNSFTPIFVQDVEELLRSDASFAESIGLGAASFIGISEQNTPVKKSKGGLQMRGMRNLKP